MKSIKSRFTLIEMLAVIAIASALLAILVPAFNKMIFGNRVDQCASNLKLGLELAQSRAISARKYVALMLPNKHDSIDTRLRAYCGGGYRLAYVKKDGSKWVFLSWVPDSEWRNPSGDGAMLVKVVENPSASGTKATSLETLPANAFAGADKLSAVEGSDEDLVAVRGTVETTPIALIFSPFGGLADHNSPLGFVITEAKIEGDNYKYENPDNYLLLKLNTITGRVEYLAED